MINSLINTLAVIGLITVLGVLYVFCDICYQLLRGRETVRELLKEREASQ